MKPIKLVRIPLLAILALGACAAVTASAEEGFLPMQKTGTLLGGLTTFSAGGLSIVCKLLEQGTITFTNDKTAEGTLRWSGCKAAGLFAIKSLAAPGSEEIFAKVQFLVCLDAKNVTIKEGKEKVTLLDNFGIAGEFVGSLHLEVPAAGALFAVTGTTLGAILTAGPSIAYSLEFLGKEGRQTVTSCMQGEKTLTHNLMTEENENRKPQASSENVEGGLVKFKEEVKLEDS
jgi:hypothetical protein